jgi:fatty-acyl-CoA synthase
MQGLMMDRALTIGSILDHAARYHGDTEIVSVNTDLSRSRTTYAKARARALKMASALQKRGMKRSDRLATIAWNNHRHFELYYAISGGGMVLHTINPRLFADQTVYVAGHAGDRMLFFDKTFLPIVEALRDKLNTVEAFVILEARDPALASRLPWLEFYEDLIATGDDDFAWPGDIDEKSASSLCYTSGTTGNPKGVLYSHRSTLLHAMMSISPDVMNFSARDCLLPVVPMFHVNAWGMAYAAPMVGAKLVLPGPGLDGKSLVGLFNDEKVSMSAGVPTIWAGLLQHLEATGAKLPFLKRTVVGGSACPPSMIEKFRKDYGVDVLHAWGMTELSPLGSVNNLKNKHLAMSEAGQNRMRLCQGRPPFGIELGIFDDEDRQLPNDGQSQGNLYCRGPWVLENYFGADAASPLRGGWFPTGDVATLDSDGYLQIRDRSKDIIKSGGEWISSVDIENQVAAHPDVKDAAVIAARHAKWDERPILLVVAKEGKSVAQDEMLAFLTGKIAKWWLPDRVIAVAEIPRNATGKIRKNVLREQYGNVLLG